MNRTELKYLFNKYLLRDFTENEWVRHGYKKYNLFEYEISKCNEYLGLLKNNIITHLPNVKMAILLSGHIRNYNILGSLTHFIKNYNVDVFIHTWDNKGIKGQETNLNDTIQTEEIKNIINNISNVKDYFIENNNKYVNSIITETEQKIYFNHSSPEIFIKSQLYSIYQSYNLMDNYSKENNIKYDMVIRLRFDCEMNLFNVNQDIINEINNNKIIFVPNKDCGHHHPDSDSTSCIACDNMYYKHNLKSVHMFEHTNVICDILAYGSQESMKDYCETYLEYDNINSFFIEENLKYIENKKIKIKKIGNIYKTQDNLLGHLESLYYLNCSYPERILQKKLKDYMLIESKNIKVKFKR